MKLHTCHVCWRHVVQEGQMTKKLDAAVPWQCLFVPATSQALRVSESLRAARVELCATGVERKGMQLRQNRGF
jgi:hypothetical protein